jgi:hypothetical protein
VDVPVAVDGEGRLVVADVVVEDEARAAGRLDTAAGSDAVRGAPCHVDGVRVIGAAMAGDPHALYAT